MPRRTAPLLKVARSSKHRMKSRLFLLTRKKIKRSGKKLRRLKKLTSSSRWKKKQEVRVRSKVKSRMRRSSLQRSSWNRVALRVNSNTSKMSPNRKRSLNSRRSKKTRNHPKARRKTSFKKNKSKTRSHNHPVRAQASKIRTKASRKHLVSKITLNLHRKNRKRM